MIFILWNLYMLRLHHLISPDLLVVIDNFTNLQAFSGALKCLVPFPYIALYCHINMTFYFTEMHMIHNLTF